MTVAESIRLRPDHSVSRLIKGGWQLAGDHGEVVRERAIADMEAFLDAGITTFDCADIYSGVEEMIGQFIASVRNRRGAETADRVCVHTKVVPDLGRLAEIGADDVRSIVERSLTRLRIDQVHLVQMYWWDLSVGRPLDAMMGLRRLQDEGKVRHIGVTNWDGDEIMPFVEHGFDIVSAQVQYSVLDRRPAATLVPWAQRNNVHLLCYGTLAGGFLTESWLGKSDPGFEFANRSLVKYRLVIDEFGSWDLFQELLSTLKAVGDRHGVSLSAVATRHVLEQPQVAAAIVGARYATHLPQTLEVFDFALEDADRAAIDAVLAQAAGPAGRVFGLERDRSGRHGRIMKYNLNASPDAPILADER